MIAVEPGRPDASEYAPGFAGYVARVPETEIIPALEKQMHEVSAALSRVPEKSEQFRYAEGKWSFREVLGHIIDTERVMGYRGVCIARGETVSLPGFDENHYAQNSPVDAAPLKELLQEFEFLRKSHVLFFSHLTREGWLRRGIANEATLSPRAVAYVMVGHVRHHLHVLSERYFSVLER